ncbi:MAG: sulfocyanin-like copper-binding protein [Armatimonadota bacterium]
MEQLKPGTYEVVCTIPGHQDAGMKVRLEVSS